MKTIKNRLENEVNFALQPCEPSVLEPRKLDAKEILEKMQHWILHFNGKVTDFILLADAKTLIEELTTKIAKWEEECDLRGDMWSKLNEENKKLTEENERLQKANDVLLLMPSIKDVQFDTVRKMAERLMQKILENTVGNDSFAYFLKGYIDQIAKEVLEGKSDT